MYVLRMAEYSNIYSAGKRILQRIIIGLNFSRENDENFNLKMI